MHLLDGLKNFLYCKLEAVAASVETVIKKCVEEGSWGNGDRDRNRNKPLQI